MECVEELFDSNHGPRGSVGATIGETVFTCVCIGKNFKNLLFQNHWARNGPRGLGGATIGETVFTCVYIGKNFKNLLLQNYWARKYEIYMEAV